MRESLFLPEETGRGEPVLDLLRKGWTGEEVRLVDATKLSADQNTSVSIEDVSHDGGILVYGIRVGGADEMAVHVIDVEKRQEYKTS